MNARRSSLSLRSGFALIVTLSLMILMALIAVGILTLGANQMRVSSRSQAIQVAQANARLALTMAIGELQRAAGADQRVTARADITNAAVINPGWTGAWDTRDATKGPVWLVSGVNSSPSDVLDETNSVALDPETVGEKRLRAPTVTVEGDRWGGRYAWWVGDEGTKARIDLAVREDKNPVERRRELARSPQTANAEKLGPEFSADVFGMEVDAGRETLISNETVGLAADDREVPARYFDDFTTGGFGLPVNVKEGGFKKDLSLVFDRSQRTAGFVEAALGAKADVTAGYGGEKIYTFQVTDKEEFYLSDSLRKNYKDGIGPNWGILYNYAHLWENRNGAKFKQVAIHPRVETNLRQNKWQPYDNDGTSSYNKDRQHRNSQLSPVLAVIQMGMYLGARSAPAPKDSAGKPKPGKWYQVELHVKPVVGLWNPYNVPIEANRYRFEWAIAPFMRIDFQKPNPNGTFPDGSGYVTEMWLRDYWLKSYGGQLPTDDNKGGGSVIRLATDAVDFQPGEFRLFSAEGSTALSSNKNKLVPKLDPKGSYKFDIKRSETNATGKAGDPLLIPEGFYGWFGDVFLQDTQWNGATSGTSFQGGTKAHFKGKLDQGAAKTWITMKNDSNNAILSRYTDLWNGGDDEKSAQPYMPEPLRTDRSNLNADGSGGKTPHRVENLAAGNLGPIGTWRFYLRNATEIDDANQQTRAWIDSNPVTPVVNVRLDGSKSTSTDREGWNVMSHFMGGAHRSGARKGVVGDGEGGNRGLVAEGAFWSTAIPQGNISDPNRWQGYLGAGSTATTGVTHAVIYDVPLAPPVSIGQFQHAGLSRYQYEPGFVVGNSYANPRIPLDQTEQQNFAGMGGVLMVDTSYEINENLWDNFFFSTLSPDYQGGAGGNYDSVLSFDDLSSGETLLPNPRMVFRPRSGDTNLEKIISEAGTEAPEAMASRISVTGAFNVNSTSVPAWRAFLGSMAASELPVVNPATGAVTWEKPEGTRFNRFGQVLADTPFEEGSGVEPSFFQSWRKVSEDELEELAKAIVDEVRERGPFLSMAEFVNRDLDSSDPDLQRKGALQSALDDTINNKLSSDFGSAAQVPAGSQFVPAVVQDEKQVAGHAAYLLQGDVLQSLSPVMQVRSDYFRIRTYGDARDSSGKVIARAWCEALVQRVPEYLDGVDEPEVKFDGLSKTNKEFGRRFTLVSFRWLSPEEV